MVSTWSQGQTTAKANSSCCAFNLWFLQYSRCWSMPASQTLQKRGAWCSDQLT